MKLITCLLANYRDRGDPEFGLGEINICSKCYPKVILTVWVVAVF